MDGTTNAPIQRLILAAAGELFFQVDDLLNLGEEPAVDFGEIENVFDGKTGAQGVANKEDALGVRDGEFAGDDIARKDVAIAVNVVVDAPRFAVAADAVTADFERAQTFLQRFLEGPPDGHGF